MREGLELSCRLVIDGVPRRIAAVIERAELQSQSRAALLLQVVAADGDGQRRRHHQVDAELPAILHPIVCDRLVPDDLLHGVVGDLSLGGVAVTVPDLRGRPGDRMRLSARAFEGVIDCELRVTSVRGGERPGTLVLGCAFLDPSPHLLDVITRLRARLQPQPAPATGLGEIAA